MIDIRTYGAVPDGVTDCASAINSALLAGDIIIKDGTFLINESIKIPSNRTVYGKNALLKLGAEIIDNVFRNSDFINGNVNINIVGQGNFCIQSDFDDNYATYTSTGANSYRYVVIQIHNVIGFSIKNIYVVNYIHHCIHLAKCSNGEISNIYFNEQTASSRNRDGIDILWDVHDITINKLSGYSSDDFICLDAGNNAGLAVDYSAGFNVGDIHDIEISDLVVKHSAYGRVPALICGNGNKIYNIDESNVVCESTGSLFFTDYTSWEGTPPALGDVYNITIDNAVINACADDAVFIFGEHLQDSAFTNIVNNSGKPLFTIMHESVLDNVTINGVQVE